MSEYHQVSVEFHDEESLVSALKETNSNYNPTIHEEAVHLYGYHGDKRKEKANIVIPRNQISSASNDVGFLKKKDGSYEMIVSEYDQSYTWNKEFVNKLKQNYAKNVIVKNSKKMKHKIRSQQIQADGSIKIKVRVRE